MRHNDLWPANNELLQAASPLGTPIFVYNTAVMKHQYERLTAAFRYKNTHFHYACKALPNLSVLRYFASLGAGLDTVSIGEVKLGLKAGFSVDNIIFTPNCVDFEEVKEAVELGVHVNIDNLSTLEHFGAVYGNSIPVGVRINPHIMAGGNAKISVGHIDSKFGISIHQLRHLQRIVKTYNLNISGLHMHTGSDILDVEVFLKGAELLFETAAEFKNLDYLDFGSGFKVPYKPDDLATDIEDLGVQMSERMEKFAKETGSKPMMIFEPGKFLVSESGKFLCKVNVIKHTTATVFAGVNTGFNHFLRPMFYNAYHHITNLSNPEGKPRIYTVVGNICETDTFAWDRRIEEIREGDILCFHNAGAYVSAMGSSYNSRPKPAEALWHDGKLHLVTKRETLEDLTQNQVDELRF